MMIAIMILSHLSFLSDPPQTGVEPQQQKKAAVFQDDFESGTVDNWSQTVGGPPSCNCYFSGDCTAGMFCDWGPGGYTVEDICAWALPKPNGIPGAGCFEDYNGPWGPVCDGFCASATAGSLFGWEHPALVQQGISHWAEAILIPSMAGGGPLDPAASAAALAIPFENSQTGMLLGRQTADLFIVTGGIAFYHYFCHYEFNDPDPQYYVDISGEPEVADASMLVVQALLAEIDAPGSGRAYINMIPEQCPNWQTMFTHSCEPGPTVLDCVTQRIVQFAIFLTTPAARP